jgi:hypothetical protein
VLNFQLVDQMELARRSFFKGIIGSVAAMTLTKSPLIKSAELLPVDDRFLKTSMLAKKIVESKSDSELVINRNYDELFSHFAEKFDPTDADVDDIRMLFKNRSEFLAKLGDAEVLSTPALERMSSGSVPLAVTRELLSVHRVWFNSRYVPMFSTLIHNYAPIISDLGQR